MKKTLGIDIGTNSIGWALIDNDNLVEQRVRIFTNERVAARQERRATQRFGQRAFAFYQQKIDFKTNPVLIALIVCILFTGISTAINFINWQFWLNLSLTTFVATLTLLHQDRKK
jgi:hypothetical protein